jgi:antitoxin MazE
MRTRVQKWGNSLAVRIPKVLAREAALEQDAEVELRVESGRLVLIRVTTPDFSLDELLARVTPENIHGQTDTGSSTGREDW